MAFPLSSPVVPESVHVFAVATKHGLGVHNLVASLRHHGFGYDILKYGEAWGGWRFRMEAYRDAASAHARAHGPTSLIVFIDAYDALCTRDAADGIVSAFRAFQKPILIGLEAGCKVLGKGSNCGDISRYWATTRGKPPARPNRFANGGCILGEAHAVSAVYAWMLVQGFADDQVGLAEFTNAHPQLVAADETSRIILNHYWSESRCGRIKSNTHQWFVHLPGYKGSADWFGYADLVREHGGPFGIAVDDVSTQRWEGWTYIVPLLLVLILILACSAAFAMGKSRGVALMRRAAAATLSPASSNAAVETTPFPAVVAPVPVYAHAIAQHLATSRAAPHLVSSPSRTSSRIASPFLATSRAAPHLVSSPLLA